MSTPAAINLRRMRQCELDLKRNGIDLAETGGRRLRLLVRQHLDYFQLMLGYDAAASEVVALESRLRGLRRARHPAVPRRTTQPQPSMPPPRKEPRDGVTRSRRAG